MRDEEASEAEGPTIRHSEFVGGLDFYPGVIQGIEEVLAEVAPHVAELDAPGRIWAPLGAALKAVPEDRRAEVIQTIRPHLETGLVMVGPLLSDVVNAFLMEPWGSSLLRGLKEVFSRRPRTPVLLNSLLTHAVSAFESHLGDVAGSIYRAAPGALDASARDPEFSLADLNELGSIEDARHLAISRRVDRLSRGNLGDWRKHFKDGTGIDLASVAIDYKGLQEIMQRRNAIVHHDGRASRQYVKNTGRTDIAEGDDLSCDAAYVTTALDELLVTGFLLSLECFRKFQKDEEYACQRLHQFEESQLLRGRWRALEKVSSHGLNYNDDAAGRHVFQVNVWLARKYMHGLDAIREDVSRWDVSASDALYVVARACLLDDLDTAIELLPDLVERGPLTGTEVLDWPIFEGVRADPRFELLKESIWKSVVEEEDETEFTAAPGSRTYHLRGCRRAGARAVPVGASELGGRRPAKCCLSEAGAA